MKHCPTCSCSGARRPGLKGDDYIPEVDWARLTGGLKAVRDVVIDGRWRTNRELAEEAGVPIESATRYRRYLKQPEYGAHAIDRRRVGDPRRGLYEYKVLPEGTAMIKCLPCAMDRHDECEVDTGRSIMTIPCSCSEEHTREEDPRPRRRVVRRRVRP